ncbi:type VI secretion system lipoprotein TssJ [Ideonella sp. BN130291]|nr:type VI secretion system lipoprotein TssJ [Ideonella sp. BN130291]
MLSFQAHVIAPRTLRLLPLVTAFSVLTGCAATKVADETLGDLTKSLLESTGLKKPEAPKLPEVPQAEALRLPRKVALRVHAGQELNHDAAHKPLSLVLRIYKLKSTAAFLQAPYEAFASPGREKEVLGDDVLDMREVTLVPGQRYEAEEKVPRDAVAVGVVALFNAPSPQRWKYVFDAGAAEKSGLVLGAHGCALTVAQGAPVGTQLDAQRLGGTRCGET